MVKHDASVTGFAPDPFGDGKVLRSFGTQAIEGCDHMDSGRAGTGPAEFHVHTVQETCAAVQSSGETHEQGAVGRLAPVGGGHPNILLVPDLRTHSEPPGSGDHARRQSNMTRLRHLRALHDIAPKDPRTVLL